VRTLAVALGVMVLGGLVVLAVAGVSGATAILVTGVAIFAMIGLGNTLGGRHTPSRAPAGPTPPRAEPAESSPSGSSSQTATGGSAAGARGPGGSGPGASERGADDGPTGAAEG
jgi:hypothetical protein